MSATGPLTRTVVITGHRSEMDQRIQELVAEGANAVCYKPFDIPHLLTTLQQIATAHPDTDTAG